jgi:hypothetical protein
MNYQKIYDNLIYRGKKRQLAKDDDIEVHHIVPKCLGGNNDNTNLVRLTIREHFLAHLLLCKIYPTHLGLYKAVFLMSKTRALKSSRDFEIYKSKWRRLVKSKQQLRNLTKSMMSKNADYNKEFANWWNNTEWMTHHSLGKVVMARPRIDKNLINENEFKILINGIKPVGENISKDDIATRYGIGKNKAKRIKKLIKAGKKQVVNSAIEDFIAIGSKYYNNGENYGK